jgi:HEAT repeat protein
MVGEARRVVIRGRIRQRLERVASGASGAFILEANWPADDVLLALRQVCIADRGRTSTRARLCAAVRGKPLSELLFAPLDNPRTSDKRTAIELIGLIGVEEAVPWLSRLLGSPDASLRNEAARALGRIGGARSADALVKALYWRRGSSVRLAMELARAAPVLYLERALVNPDHRPVRVWLAIATGLRRRRSAVASLMRLLAEGSRVERVAACRALGWIGDPRSVEAIQGLLTDSGWQVRSSAARALEEIGDPSCIPELEANRADPNQKVRSSIARAVVRLRWTASNTPGAVASWR